MRGFILGVIITLIVLGLGGLALAFFGFIPTNADATPPVFERRIAMSALDASMDRHAPHVTNPVLPTDENLIDGMKIYTMTCAECHGGLDRKPSPMAHSFYPPVPSLIVHPMDDPEWQVFYVIRTGIRYTAMPSWEGSMSEADMWKVTSFLTRVGKLPPAVQDFWQKSSGVPAPVEGEHHHDHANH